MKNIDIMHSMFGELPEHKCGECSKKVRVNPSLTHAFKKHGNRLVKQLTDRY